MKQMKLNRTSGRKPGSKNYFGDCLGLRDSYKFYRKSITFRQKGSVKDPKLYTAICKLANEKIMKKIIEESLEFVMPFGLGRIRIKKKKVDRVCSNLIDWPASEKAGKLVGYTNDHSNGFLMKFFWDKYHAVVVNIYAYVFEAAKVNRQLLAHTIRTNPKVDYFE